MITVAFLGGPLDGDSFEIDDPLVEMPPTTLETAYRGGTYRLINRAVNPTADFEPAYQWQPDDPGYQKATKG